uniref:Reverse transcriptase zinc-binding domain-containing protein n=1 Tax=Cannabis sativa TaxID=3483 RepID=A0A803PT66_CANSA
MQNALPTTVALHRQKGLDSAACSMCTSAWESFAHALFNCPHSKSVWKYSGFIMDYKKAQLMYNGDYLFHLSTLHSQIEFELIICIKWAIWWSRNKSLHGSKTLYGKQTATFAKDYLEKLKLSSSRKQSNASQRDYDTAGPSSSSNNDTAEVHW